MPSDASAARSRIMTLEEAAHALRKSKRWLNDWLRRNPADKFGEPYYAQLSRTRRLDERDLSRIWNALREKEKCRLNSSRLVPAKRRIGQVAAPTSADTLTEALRLAGGHSR
jgi:hypothetical protein